MFIYYLALQYKDAPAGDISVVNVFEDAALSDLENLNDNMLAITILACYVHLNLYTTGLHQSITTLI